MKIEELYKLYLQNPSVETDTRKLKTGDIFVALKGPNFNGNDYIEQALQSGAAFCISDEARDFKNEQVILVADSLATLQELAKYHRQQFNIPVIAITGSNGKTTTKELIHEVLSTTYKTYTTHGNLNNHIGIPLTLLRIKADAEIAVIEMGANHLKEIERYCSFTLPTHGLITNCGKAHLEGFGSEEGVRKGKGELFDYLRQSKGTAFIYKEYTYLQKMSAGIPTIITYGKSGASLNGIMVNEGNFLSVEISGDHELSEINTQLVGDYNLPNILAAVCIGKTFQVTGKNIKNALEHYKPTNSRSQLIERDSNQIILDAYNANPTSMKAAIENFARMPGNKKILMLGAMKELGESSIDEHEAIVQLISKYQWEKVILVGKDYGAVAPGQLHFDEINTAKEWFKTQHFKDAQILIKGSRGIQMEKILE